MSDDSKVVDIITKQPHAPREPTSEEIIKKAEDNMLWCCNQTNFKNIGFSLYCSCCLHKFEGCTVHNPDDLDLAPPEDGVHEDD